MHAVAHRLAGDRDRLAAGRAGFAVGRDCELEHDVRAAVAHAADVAGMVAARLVGADADLDDNAGRAQPRMAGAGDFGIGIFERGDDARNSGGDDGIGAGRRFAVMRAGLERDVERRAARRGAGAAQRLDLGMRPAAGLSPAAADDDAVLDDDGADGGIGPGAAKPAPAERKRERHEAPIFRQSVQLRIRFRACPGAHLARSLRGLVARQFGERGLEILGFAEIP